MAKDFAKAFYRSKAWRNVRAEHVAMVGGLCEQCLKKGLVVPGVELHHIQPLTPDNIGDASVSLNHSNLILLCHDCHSNMHNPNVHRYVVDELGRVTPK